jgi:radical SAM superfamily enzyme YgiQ (UPF0313 family)
MVCLEDGINSCGFRHMAAYAKRLVDDTRAYFVSTQNYRDLRHALAGRVGSGSDLPADDIDEIAQGLVDADILGFSSMTGYSDLTKAVIRRVRELSAKPYIIWGGIHPIIHPEDAIRAEVDAICVGEGEFALEEFLDAYRDGRDFTATKNFWFRKGAEVIRNGFRPLMSPEDMEGLPFPLYAEHEWIHRRGEGFVPMGVDDYLRQTGLSYNTVWSIGCPFHCTFCGNTKFIANDIRYKKIRHPSPEYAIGEIKAARAKHPHLSSVCFHDDSFMAIPYRQIEEFAIRWHDELGMPFAVYGVIPNYVQRDKFEVLTWAGMNRVRMGIQSGSERLLEFYKRPTPIEKVEAAATVCASFAPRYHVPPAYDFIMDNPVEKRQDVIDTLELAYRLARPFTMNLYSLRIIPNTEMEKVMLERGIDVESISGNYLSLPPRWANLMMHLLAVWRPPRWLFDRLLKRARACTEPQREYPQLAFFLRVLFLTRRGLDHLRCMDFSTIPGRFGYFCWRFGVLTFWRRYLTPRPAGPTRDREIEPLPLSS